MSLYPVVILAGGLATRLRPITKKIPKALVEIGGKPFIYHQLQLLRSHGIRRVIISAWYRGDMIRDYVGDGRQFDMDVNYVFDGDVALGTGGAIRKALPLLDSSFFVLYGDSYLPCDYADIQKHFEAGKLPALMTVFRNLGKWDSSNVEMADGRIAQYDKRNCSPRMEHIDYGLGIFVTSVFDKLQENRSADLAEIYQKLVIEKKLLAYDVSERFYEVGSFDGLKELDELLTKDPDQFLKKE
jgi:MurNAc alpha-1-phosphate uridylyltransferase